MPSNPKCRHSIGQQAGGCRDPNQTVIQEQEFWIPYKRERLTINPVVCHKILRVVITVSNQQPNVIPAHTWTSPHCSRCLGGSHRQFPKGKPPQVALAVSSTAEALKTTCQNYYCINLMSTHLPEAVNFSTTDWLFLHFIISMYCLYGYIFKVIGLAACITV